MNGGAKRRLTTPSSQALLVGVLALTAPVCAPFAMQDARAEPGADAPRSASFDAASSSAHAATPSLPRTAPPAPLFVNNISVGEIAPVILDNGVVALPSLDVAALISPHLTAEPAGAVRHAATMKSTLVTADFIRAGLSFNFDRAGRAFHITAPPRWMRPMSELSAVTTPVHFTNASTPPVPTARAEAPTPPQMTPIDVSPMGAAAAPNVAPDAGVRSGGAATAQSIDETDLSASVRLAGQSIGTLDFARSHTGGIIVQRAAAIGLLRPHLQSQTMQRLEAMTDGQLFLSEGNFAAAGLRLKFDAVTRQFEVSAPASSLVRGTAPLPQVRAAPSAPAPLTPASAPAASAAPAQSTPAPQTPVAPKSPPATPAESPPAAAPPRTSPTLPQITVGPREQTPTPVNPTGRVVTLTVPLKDRQFYLGDVDVTLGVDNSVSLAPERLLELLSRVLDARALDALRADFASRTRITPSDMTRNGFSLNYDPSRIELSVEIPPSARSSQTLQLADIDRDAVGTFAQPAAFSAYLNARASFDYVHRGANEGLADPTVLLDFASRLGGVVFETEGSYGNAADGGFQRQGSRFVWDDLQNITRWTLGDLRPVGRGFQNSPEVAGISLFRSYSQLEPQRNTRPRGERSFTITRPSNIEVYINEQLVRRLRLEPGVYNVRDFPFAQGANEVRLVIEDDAGQRETISFSLAFDRAQLAQGLTEYGLYLGVASEFDGSEPRYDTDQQIISGFYRFGITDSWTAGVNAQADKTSRLVGVESVFGIDSASFGFDFAYSDSDRHGGGWAVNLGVQRLLQQRDGQSESITFDAEARSEKFAPIGALTVSNPNEYELGLVYSRSFGEYAYITFDGRFAKERASEEDVQTLNATLGWRLNSSSGLVFSARHQNGGVDDGESFRLGFVARLGERTSVRTEYDTRDSRARASVQTSQGRGVGSWNASADLDRGRSSTGLNASASYLANRADLGVSHFVTLDENAGEIVDQRTAARVGMSFAFADGQFGVGRPIADGFALVSPHRSLRGSRVLVDPSEEGFASESDWLGPALAPDFGSYSPRTVLLDVPNAPQGYDLGQASLRVQPPYRAGYVTIVGSDYSFTALGRLLTRDGEPIVLLAGSAREVAAPDRPAITVFTNREGRFGAFGLRPGVWRIEMPTNPATVFEFTVQESADMTTRVGDLRPIETKPAQR